MKDGGYLSGFGNTFTTEALPGAVPVGRNSPQKVAYGLYAELLSGTAFTAPRQLNRRSWVYRLRPSVKHSGRFVEVDRGLLRTAPDDDQPALPIGQLRWSPTPIPSEPLDFVSGLFTITTAGNAEAHYGMAAHLLMMNQPMSDSYFMDADGEMLIVPQHGRLRFDTEFGVVELAPGEICVIPRGVIFRATPLDGEACAYVCENYGALLTLPELGPIGSNMLASPRDFLTPAAAFEDAERPGKLTVKWCGRLYETALEQSPLDVVGWHGNYAPYKYDLRRFAAVGSVSFDHPDPSIYTVMTSPSHSPGTANVDFVIFPERWLVQENTFRPPWYHRNVMSEFMGLIYGVYDAKPQGFVPGGMSLHNMLLPHGPDAEAFDRASQAELAPVKLTDTMAFMFETQWPQKVTRFAAALPGLQKDYPDCWSDLRKNFEPSRP